MPYSNAYEAVYDLYDPAQGWDELAYVDQGEPFNVAEASLGRHGDSEETALRLRDFETGESERYSYGELNAAANRVANWLTDRTDRGDRVGTLLPTRLELYAVLFGTLKAGRTHVPMASTFGPDAVRPRLEDADVSAFVTTADRLDRLGDAIPPVVERVGLVDGESGATDVDGEFVVDSYDAITRRDPTFDSVRTSPDELFAICYTSGTTGEPEAVPMTHGAMVGLHAAIEYVVDLRPDDVYFVASSPAWAYGLAMGSLAPGLYGTAIGCYRGAFDPETFVDTLARFGVTNAMALPTALRKMAAAGVEAPGVDLRVLVSTGEALDEGSVRWCEETLGTKPQDVYGLTEMGIRICNYAFDDWVIKPGSIGRPMPGTEIALLDDDGDPVERGDVGEICIRTGEDDEDGSGGWFRTADLARRDEDGYYWFVGRADSVIISAGYRISPEEVERTLMSHDAVAEVAVVGVPDETRGEVVKAYVTVVPPEEPSEELADRLRSFTRSELSAYAYPREIEFREEFPRTSTGKIARSELE